MKNLYFKYLKLTAFRNFKYLFIWETIRKTIFYKDKGSNFERTQILGIKLPKKVNKFRVAVLIDEFFGGMNTAFGGYGFLARKYIAPFIPNEEIEIEFILGRGKHKFFAHKEIIDGVNVFKTPKKTYAINNWLKKQKYNIFLSIELTSAVYDVLKHYKSDYRLIFWIQDPRPWSDWLEINTVNLWKEHCYWNFKLYEFVNSLYKKNRVKFISQAEFLNKKAKELYCLDNNVQIQYLPNPVLIEKDFNPEKHTKKNHIIFLGRIESVKRGWIFCETAKHLPQYEFFILGQTFRDKEAGKNIMSKYKDIANLHFVGHVDGEEKKKYLRDAKILINTSIHEALPISFLEALAFGTLIISCQNPDNLTAKFGIYTGTILGDGFNHIDLFVNAVKILMEDDNNRRKKSLEAYEYVKNIHSIHSFINNLRNIIKQECSSCTKL